MWFGGTCMRAKGKATSLDIAYLAGVSQPTVSRALRGSPTVSEETRRRILQIASELNYRVDKNASNLRFQQSGTLALLFFEDPTLDEILRVEGSENVWALGDGAAVINTKTPGVTDPPTCQHALRQARRLAKNLRGEPKPYGYTMIGQGATLGRDKGIANLFGRFNFRGFAGSLVTRVYHLHQLPLASRRMRVVADSNLSGVFGRDMADLGELERSIGGESHVERKAA